MNIIILNFNNLFIKMRMEVLHGLARADDTKFISSANWASQGELGDGSADPDDM